MAVVLATGTVASLELEPLTGGDLPPRVRFTVSGDATVRTYRLTRLCEGDTNTVPGWRGKTFSDVAVDVDWAAPIGRPVTYSLYADDVLVLTAVVQLDSPTGVIQDPVDPVRWMPVSDNGKAPGVVGLGVIGEVQHPTGTSAIPVMGSPRPVAIGGQVQRGTLTVPLSTGSVEDADRFRDILLATPVLLLRTEPSTLKTLPAVSYLSGDVTELPVSVHYGGGLTGWRVSATLVQAVQAAAVSGLVTYDEVQQLLAGLTYDEVQAAAASTTYLDWQKNPLIYATL